jgi:hypothetical protein
MVCEYLLNPFTWAISPFQGSCSCFVMKSLTLLNLNHAEEWRWRSSLSYRYCKWSYGMRMRQHRVLQGKRCLN